MNKSILLFLSLLINYGLFSQVDSVNYNKAFEYYEAENYSGALKHLDLASQGEPFEFNYSLRSDILLETGKYDEAFTNIKEGLKVFPESFVLNNWLGIFYNLIDENETSIEVLTNCLDLAENDSEKVTAYINRAASYTSIRYFNESYEDLKAALKLDSSNIGVAINLGAICDEIGKADEGIFYLTNALPYCKEIIEKVGVLANLGFQHQQMGKYQEAIDYYNKVLEIDPNEPLGYSNRAYNKMQLNDFKGALKDIEKSIKLYPGNSYAYMVKGKILMKLEKYKDACEQLFVAIEYGFTQRYGPEVEELIQKNCR